MNKWKWCFACSCLFAWWWQITQIAEATMMIGGYTATKIELQMWVKLMWQSIMLRGLLTKSTPLAGGNTPNHGDILLLFFKPAFKALYMCFLLEQHLCNAMTLKQTHHLWNAWRLLIGCAISRSPLWLMQSLGLVLTDYGIEMRWFRLWEAQWLSGWCCHLTARGSCGVLSLSWLWTGNPNRGFVCFLLSAGNGTLWPWVWVSGVRKWIDGWIFGISMRVLE